jgi:glycogen operon protein
MQGSPDMYGRVGRRVSSSINFITAHDGFTLADLVAYNEKHNESNGENNQDGDNHNESWNCGVEGPTTDPEIKALRYRQIRNAIAMLMVSQGIPMILMGDEMGRTQFGNNNAYCHDSELTWLDWNLLKTNRALFRFVKNCIAFRNVHPALRSREYFRNQDYMGSGYPDISWHGIEAWNPDWSDDTHTLAFLLCGKHAQLGMAQDDFIYVAMNMHWEPHGFQLPQLPPSMKWRVFANTWMLSPDDICEPGTEPPIAEQSWIMVGERSVVILVGR